MKIICIQGNYEKTAAKELVFFIKPESAILRARLPFFIPDHTQRIIPRCNITLHVCKLGKNIQKKFAHLYYDKIGLGIDMEAADTLGQCMTDGHPWEPAKAYDCSSPVGSFIPVEEFSDIKAIAFSMFKNGHCHVAASSTEMLFSFDDIIAHVSKYITLKQGDHIFTGSPPLNDHISIGDTLDCFIGQKKMLSVRIK